MSVEADTSDTGRNTAALSILNMLNLTIHDMDSFIYLPVFSVPSTNICTRGGRLSLPSIHIIRLNLSLRENQQKKRNGILPPYLEPQGRNLNKHSFPATYYIQQRSIYNPQSTLHTNKIINIHIQNHLSSSFEITLWKSMRNVWPAFFSVLSSIYFCGHQFNHFLCSYALSYNN